MNLRKMTSGKVFANGYNEFMMNVFHLLEYNASLGPKHLSNDASFVIFFCVKDAGRRPIKITALGDADIRLRNASRIHTCHLFIQSSK